MRCQDRSHLTLIADVCTDDAEVLALAILRFVAAGYLTCDVACWDAAYDEAERRLGPVEGPQAVAAMTGVLRAIRKERQGDWLFMPATCCRATDDECKLLDLIGMARRGVGSELEQKAVEFTGAREAPCLCASLQAAAGMLAILQPRIIHRKGKAMSGTSIH